MEMERSNGCMSNNSNEKGEAALKLIDNLTSMAAEVQAQVLRDILTRNSYTEYLSKFLHGKTDYQSFKSNVPVVNYEDIRPYIQRIANGDSSPIICSEPISELLTSSGTSGGQPKVMPTIREELDRKTLLYNLLMPIVNQYVPGLDKGKGMYLLFVKSEITTPSGLKARPVLTSYYKSENFKNRGFDKYNVYTSPDETILCPDARQSIFCQLLCGLIQKDEVVRLGAVFASAFIRAIKFLEENWRELCSIIRTGNLSDWIDDMPTREAVMKLVAPNPALADEIEAECSKSSWEKIIPRIWKRTKYVDVIVTGSMAQYIPTLDFYSGGLPLVCTMYASSECYFGVNLTPLSKPSEVSYTLLPNMCYYEFLPLHKSVDDDFDVQSNGHGGCLEDQLVDLDDVRVGQYYELVVTTFAGLYRYRVGDILLATGFHNKAPQFQFVYRRNVVLSIDTDKTNEEDLLKAVTNAKKLLEPYNTMLCEYTSYADTSSIPGHYVLYWELSSGLVNVEDSVMEECCYMIEESLDSVYRRCRSKDKSIGPLEIRVVENGTFDALMDYCINHGSSYNQYKTPRCIKSPQALSLLDSRVIGSYLSQSVPSWSPYRPHLKPLTNGNGNS